MSELRSTIDELRAEVLPELPDARLEDDFIELHRACQQLEAQRLRRLAEIDRRGLHERDGHLSAAAWLVARLGEAWGQARQGLRLARALEQMPLVRKALDEGSVSLPAARALAAAHRAAPEAFERAEGALVKAATAHRIAELATVLSRWHEMAQAHRDVDPAEIRRASRRLHASVMLGGTVRVDGDLDPETGEALLTALGAVMDAEVRSGADETRTPAQRRADALGEICRAWLDRPDRPQVAGQRPHLTVTVDMAALSSRDGTGRFDHTGPADVQTIRRLACDGSITRVVMAGRSEPLDVGRATPVVPAPMRRAVIVRDRGCRFPGCDRPHPWCDAHHVAHWADGGPTAAANLLLLCRRHHRMVHDRGGFGLELVDGRPVFRRSDGSVLEDDRAPP